MKSIYLGLDSFVCCRRLLFYEWFSIIFPRIKVCIFIIYYIISISVIKISTFDNPAPDSFSNIAE